VKQKIALAEILGGTSVSAAAAAMPNLKGYGTLVVVKMMSPI
jgi:hypothetical protein